MGLVRVRSASMLAVFGTLASACSGPASSGGDGNKNGETTGFQPAVAPETACSLLTTEDVRTIFPNAEVGQSGPPLTNENGWVRTCVWMSPGAATSTTLLPEVSLDVIGALTLSAASSLLLPPATNRGGTREELQGLGDEAAYFDSPISGIGVVSNSKSYAIELDASDFQSPPAKDSLVALVRKVIGELQ